MEKIDGPIDGFFVAAYAAQVGNTDSFNAYAKVCAGRPATYWGADCIFKLFAGEGYPSAVEALAFANIAARAQIARLPAHDLANFGFAMFDESRQLVFPLASAIQQRLP